MRDYSRAGFAVSDILLAYLVEPASSAGAADPAHYVRNGTTIHPAPWGVFGVDQPLYIYFEMYNLEQEAGGQTRYEVEALLVEQGRESGLQRLFRRAFRRGGGGEGVAVRFDGVGNSADEGQYFIMDASQQPPGTYVLALRVTDLVREQTVESRRTVMLE